MSLGVPEVLREMDDKTMIADYDGGDRLLVLVQTVSANKRGFLKTGWAREAAVR